MLFVKTSQIPHAGNGLWTTDDIRKGDIVCEYEGEKITWKECERRDDSQENPGAYYFYISPRNCVDAQHATSALARYANDAIGFTRVEGIRNNCNYEVRKGIPYIVAFRNIKAGSEILVSYGKSYWKAMEASLKQEAPEGGQVPLSENHLRDVEQELVA